MDCKVPVVLLPTGAGGTLYMRASACFSALVAYSTLRVQGRDGRHTVQALMMGSRALTRPRVCREAVAW